MSENWKNQGDERKLEATMNRLAEIALETPEAELLGENGPGELLTESAKRVRHVLWTTAKAHLQRPLMEALARYQKEVEAVRKRPVSLPTDPAARREMLSLFFQQRAQAGAAATFTVQHRDFKTMSDADVESLLKQLQALGALPSEES
jgi:hypothetical protein